MKVLLVNGSPHQKGCTYTALQETAEELQRQGMETELLWLTTKAVPGCMACGACWTSGQCVRGDLVNEVLARLDEFDGFVFGSPVYYSGPSGQLCSFMDRLFYAGGSRMAGKVAASVVSCRRGGATESFERLNQYYLMNNMILPGSQYWNQIHGNSAEEARQDLEGLQTMRTLARNMAWILKCIEAGKKAGIPLPEQEQKTFTNFIR